MPTLIVALIVIAVLVLAVLQLRKDKKAGKPMCGGQCSNCPNGALCASQKKAENSNS